jgi:hypothetical protein
VPWGAEQGQAVKAVPTNCNVYVDRDIGYCTQMCSAAVKLLHLPHELHSYNMTVCPLGSYCRARYAVSTNRAVCSHLHIWYYPNIWNRLHVVTDHVHCFIALLAELRQECDRHMVVFLASVKHVKTVWLATPSRSLTPG